MKPTKPKRRVLTAREKLMRKRHTLVVKGAYGYCVFLKVGSLEFKIHGDYDPRSDAEWIQYMLATAIAKIEL